MTNDAQAVWSDDTGTARPLALGVLGALVGGFYFGSIVAAIDAAAQRQRARVLALETTPTWAREPTDAGPYVPIGLTHVDGLIVIGNALGDADCQRLAAIGKPMVTISRANPLPHYPAVYPDNRGGATAAVRHLIAHGHRRVAFVGLLEQEDIRQRYDAYCAALAEANIRPDPNLVFSAADYMEHGGAVAAAAMVAAGMPCTAVFAATDLNALGLMAAVQEADYRVPEDLAIFGFDDCDLASTSVPSLSSVRQDFGALGTRAAEELLAILHGSATSSTPLVVPTSLICRHSCGCTGVDRPTASDDVDFTHASWEAQLMRRLAATLLWPSQPDAGRDAADIWPGAATVVAGLRAALEDLSRPSVGSLDAAWSEAWFRSRDASTLHNLLALLESAGEVRVALAGAAQAGARLRLERFLAEARLTAMRCAAVRDRHRRGTEVTRVVEAHNVMMAMLRPAAQGHASAANLGWAQHTSLRRCCLALWDDVQPPGKRALAISGAYDQAGRSPVGVGTKLGPLEFPPPAFFDAGIGGALFEPAMVIPLGMPERAWGYLAAVGPPEGLFFDLHDTLRYWAGLLTAGLEHEEVVAALHASQTRLRSAIAHSPIILFALDADGVVTFYDGGTADVGAVDDPSTVLGQSMYDLFASSAEILAHTRRALAGETFSSIVEIANSIFEVWWTPEFDGDGRQTGGTGVAVDVSETVRARQAAEQARAATVDLAEVRSSFVASVSHELRTPLTSIIGYGELLQARWNLLSDAHRRERLDRIVSSANRQLRLVEDLLLLSRLDSDATPLAALPCRIADLMHTVIGELQGKYHGQQFVVEGPDDLYVLADPGRVTQVLVNLADNAAKYSPDGRRVTISWRQEDHMIVIRVLDEGPGIADEYQSQLFTRFGRIPASRIRAGHVGTGLGLYLGRSLAHAMGGELDLESTGPSGSVFRLSLPYCGL